MPEPALPAYLVALDSGRRFGWAHGPLGAVVPLCGYWQLPAKDDHDVVGARIANLENTLIAAFDEWQPGYVVMAEGFISRSRSDAESTLGMVGQVRAECWRRRISFRVQPEGTVRREMLGRGSGPSEVMKALAMAWCRRLGIEAHDHNAADSAVLWKWTRDELVRQRRGKLAA